MTYPIRSRPYELDPVAKGVFEKYTKDEQAMAKAARITKTKKLGPEDLQLGEMYFLTGNGFSLYRTREAAVADNDWTQRTGSLHWHENFIVVSKERLLKEKPGSQRKYLLKIMSGEKMGWLTAHEVRKVFKKLEPNAIEEDNSKPKLPLPDKSRQWGWSLLPKK